jgi:hypothetical protein
MLLLAVNGKPANDHPLCKEGFLRIVSPDALEVSMDQCRAVARQTIAAWKFDLSRMRWTDLTEMEKPLTLRVVGINRMKTEYHGVLGFARGRDLFVVSTAVLDDPFANGTLAHELAHIQAKRALGKFSEKQLAPRYFIEGHGNIMGRAYRDYLGIVKHDYDASKARRILRFTEEEARTILTDNSYGTPGSREEDKMEAMGIFFMEYLRVRLHHRGVPEVVERMGRVFELVGHGETYQTAFQQQFGEPVDQVVAEILSFIGRTRSNPAERLRGTRYEQFL